MKTFTLFILLILTSVAFAELKSLQLSLKQVKSLVGERPNLYLENVQESSQGNRNDKMFQASAGLGLILARPGYRIDVGTFLEESTLVGVRFSRASLKTETYRSGEFGSFRVDNDADLKLISAYLKRFVGNSFYLDGVIGHRTIESETSANTSKIVITDEHQAIVTSFNIGNQWQWNSFTMGVDWVGINLRLHTLKEWKYSPELNYYRQDFEKFGTDYSVNLLTFYLGVSF